MRLILLIIFALIHTLPTQINFDSLETVYKSADKQSKQTILLKIIDNYDKTDKLQYIHYNKELLNLLPPQKNNVLKGYAYNNLAKTYADLGSLKKSLILAEKALQYNQKADYTKGIYFSQSTMAETYRKLGQYDKTIDLLEKSIDNDSLNIANAHRYNSLGNVYQELAQYNRSLEMYLLSLESFERLEKNSHKIDIYSNIGIIYLLLNDYKHAQEYFELVISESKSKKVTEIAYNNLASLYLKKGDYDKAVKNFIISLKLIRELKDKWSEGVTLSNLCEVYIAKKNFSQAESYNKQALAINENLGSKSSLVGDYLSSSKILRYKGKYQKALKINKQAFNLAKELKAKESLIETLKEQTEIYQSLNRYQKALHSFKKMTVYKDSLLNEKSNNRINELLIQYDTVSKEKENIILKEKNKAKIGQLKFNKRITTLSFLSLILAVLFLYIMYRRIKEKVKINKLITSQKKELTKTLEREQQAQEALIELEKKNSVLAMIVTANHEINQPLCVAINSLDMFKMLNTTELTPKQEKFINLTILSLEKIADITHKYADAENISFGKYVNDVDMVIFDKDENQGNEIVEDD